MVIMVEPLKVRIIVTTCTYIHRDICICIRKPNLMHVRVQSCGGVKDFGCNSLAAVTLGGFDSSGSRGWGSGHYGAGASELFEESG